MLKNIEGKTTMKIYRQKFLSIFMTILLVFGLLSCGVQEGSEITESSAGDTTDVIQVTPTPDHEIKNIVLIIGDGMGIEHISAGQFYAGAPFAFASWQYTSVNTDSVKVNTNRLTITDSAASGTALATGHLTVNSYLGKDATGADVPTILDYAASLNKSTGVVTTDTLYGATPAAFSAHSIDRNAVETILTTQIASNVNLLCGAVDTQCTTRQEEILDAGYVFCDDFAQVDSTLSSDKAYWQFDLAGNGASIALPDASVKALDFLDKDTDGFVLMIEQAYIDKYSHDNNFDEMVKSMSSLNDTVDAVMEWLGDRTDTVVLVTADHETGALAISTSPVLANECTSFGTPIYYKWSRADHSNAKVGLFVHGVKADFTKFDFYASQHQIKNSDVYYLMYDILSNPINYGE